MQKHSKKYIKRLYDFIEKEKVFVYENDYYAEMEPFRERWVITENTISVISVDWTDRGSMHFDYKDFDEFFKFFRKEYWFRIPIFQMLETLDGSKLDNDQEYIEKIIELKK